MCLMTHNPFHGILNTMLRSFTEVLLEWMSSEHAWPPWLMSNVCFYRTFALWHVRISTRPVAKIQNSTQETTAPPFYCETDDYCLHVLSFIKCGCCCISWRGQTYLLMRRPLPSINEVLSKYWQVDRPLGTTYVLKSFSALWRRRGAL